MALVVAPRLVLLAQVAPVLVAAALLVLAEQPHQVAVRVVQVAGLPQTATRELPLVVRAVALGTVFQVRSCLVVTARPGNCP